MKKILMIYPNQQELGCKPPGVSILAAAVKQAGHEFKLIDMTPFEIISDVVSKDIGEERFEYKKVSNPEKLPKRIKSSFEDFWVYLRKEILEYKPDLIGFSSISHFFPMTKKVGSYIKTFCPVPIIVGGVHPTICPDEVIQEPFLDIICIGEGERALVELLEHIDSGGDIRYIRNLWVKNEGKIYKNPVRPLIDPLDELPFPDWDIFPQIQFYKPYMGYVYKYGDIEKSRGCPLKCSYCINPYIHTIYGKKSYYRMKSVGRLIDELSFLKETYDLEFIRFWDELFVAKVSHFRSFSDEYSKKINLPFTIETTAESINVSTAKILKDMNCQSVSIGLETGSEELRRRILNKGTKNTTYFNAFKALKNVGIRTVAFILLALPEDSMENYWNTIRFLKEAEVDTICIGFVFPFHGTGLRTKYKTVYDNLYPGFDNDIANTKLDPYPILTDISREIWRQLADLMPIYKEVPEWLWPLIDKSGKSSDPKDREYFLFMKKLIYRNKYGEWPE